MRRVKYIDEKSVEEGSELDEVQLVLGIGLGKGAFLFTWKN